MIVAFIRHGQTEWNRRGLLQGSSDIPLNETGREQAHHAFMTLRSRPWDAVVSSPLQRARETAQIIAEGLDIPLGTAYPQLIERDYGPLEGTSAAAAIERWPDRDYPGAEALDAVATRGEAALAAIARDIPDGAVLVVCHGTIIRYTLARLAGRPVPGIDNGSISMLRLENESWQVATVNGIPLDEIPIEHAARQPSREGEDAATAQRR
ncbi:MAG: histidine phosphatase family protein [Pseudolysinimonas sp.]|jgi:probable phosphoglycerate mutase|uniref:histidine phosphatase family protein n=1 Tax=Pseudolysinimonas sp. TaxID=2680009 RepID=UPI003C767EDF